MKERYGLDCISSRFSSVDGDCSFDKLKLDAQGLSTFFKLQWLKRLITSSMDLRFLVHECCCRLVVNNIHCKNKFSISNLRHLKCSLEFFLHLTNLLRVFASIIMSSTYRRTYTYLILVRLTLTHWSAPQLLKSCFRSTRWIIFYHSFAACFTPYIALSSMHTILWLVVIPTGTSL